MNRNELYRQKCEKNYDNIIEIYFTKVSYYKIFSI